MKPQHKIKLQVHKEANISYDVHEKRVSECSIWAKLK